MWRSEHGGKTSKLTSYFPWIEAMSMNSIQASNFMIHKIKGKIKKEINWDTDGLVLNKTHIDALPK